MSFAKSFEPLPPLSLYVHLPWCERKCPYCDFNSHAREAAEIPEERYVRALIADLERDADEAGDRALESVFIGGGTPSLFSPDSIAALLEAVGRRFCCLPGMEVTLESNPGSAERSRFRGFRDAGVNRLSIGVQSFDDDLLRALGRIHDGRQAEAAVHAAADAGFERWNLDLMYALPGQTAAKAEEDARKAAELSGGHVSHYQLTLEPGTAFHRRPPADMPDEALQWAMRQRCGNIFAEAGFSQYETSAYALAAEACQHNLNYWRYGDYLGIGAGAHGKISRADGSVWRRVKTRQPGPYMAAAGRGGDIASDEHVPEAERVLEFMLNALRLNSGFTAAQFEARTGQSFASVQPALATAMERGLVERVNEAYRPSERGQRYLDDLLLLFVPEPA